MEIATHDFAEEDPADRCDKHPIEAIFFESFRYFFDAQFGADRRRRRHHRTRYWRVARKDASGRCERPDQHALGIEDCYRAIALDCGHVGNRRAKRHDGNRLQVVRNSTTITDGAIGSESQGGPRRAPADQVVNSRKTLEFEPARGPSAEVSMLIETVEHDHTVAVATRQVGLGKRLERNIVRSGQMLSRIQFGRQDIDQSGPARDQADRFVDIDSLHHA